MLFPKENYSLRDDGFEGSFNEHQIFTEVFFENRESKKKCLVTGVINFESDYSKETTASCFPDSGNSAFTSMGSLDGVVDASQQASLASSAIVTRHVVESYNYEVTYSCYLQKRHGQLSRGLEIGENDVLKPRPSNFNENDVVSKAITSLASQESHATKSLVSSSLLAVANNSSTVQLAKSKWKDDSFVELAESEFSTIKESPNDPHPILRYHIFRLLRAAGWVIGRRKRSNKPNGIGEYVYKSPEGRPIREFRRAWTMCGESLFTYGNSVIVEDDGKMWTDMNQFQSDVSSVIAEIDKKPVNLETTSSLAHLWCLLDPFANVVFIDKTLRFLKEGKAVKASRSLAKDVETTEDQPSERNVKSQCCNSSLVADSVSDDDQNIHKDCFDYGVPSHYPEKRSMSSLDIINGPAPKYRKVSRNEKGILDLSFLAACGSGGTSEQKDSCFEVPVSSGNTLTLKGRSEAVFNNHDCNTSLLSYDKNLSVYLEEEAKGFDVKIPNQERAMLQEPVAFDSNSSDDVPVDIQSLKTMTKDVSSDTNTSFKRKAKKKSKILSEMKLPNLDQHEKLAFDCKTRFSEINGKGLCGKSGSKKFKKVCLEDDDLLISAIIKNQTSKSANNRPFGKSKPLRKQKSQKGGCRLLLRSLNRGGKHFVEGKWPSFALRNVLSWLIHSGAVSINEVIQYRNLKDDSVVKDGVITRDGILCKCCGEVLSISKFKSHAGFKLNHACLNLFLKSGKPFMLCQLEAWSAEYKAKKAGLRTVQFDETDQNDDSCGRCGDGGELICCDNCPSTFHQACLYAQELPEGSWYCPRCMCRICEDVVKANESSSSSSAMKCMQCEHQYHEACLKQKGFKHGVASDIWLCGERCEEVYSGIHSLIGQVNLLADGFSWALLRCSPYDQKTHSAQRYVALNAECNSKLAVALTIMEECFLPMVDPTTGIDMMPQVIYNWGSQFPRLNYYGFYTVVLEKDDVLISVASIRIHRATVAEMPLIATCSKYRRQGMCRLLMNCIEKMLKSLKVEKLVISAIPSLVQMWTLGFGFKPLEDEEKRGMSDDNLMVFPGTVWLKKPMHEPLKADKLTGSKDASPSKEVDPGDVEIETKDSDRENLQLGSELHSRCSICSTEGSVNSQASLLEGH